MSQTHSERQATAADTPDAADTEDTADGSLPRSPVARSAVGDQAAGATVAGTSAAEAFSARRALLDAALDVFTERGYTNASVTEIAARSGIAMGSLFHHYGGKRGLYLALWEEFQEEQERRTAEVVAQARGRGVTDPIALFVAGARAYLEGAWERRRIGRLILEDDGPAGFEAMRRQWDRSWVRRNAKLLRVDEKRRTGRVRVIVLTTVIGGAARELGDCADTAEAREVVDEVCGILAHLSEPSG